MVFGQSERKAISMAPVDRALRWRELGEENQSAPTQDEESVLMHADNIQATGLLGHIKLPHYVDFQSELELVRRMRRAAGDWSIWTKKKPGVSREHGGVRYRQRAAALGAAGGVSSCLWQ